jgi:hypothetical protein
MVERGRIFVKFLKNLRQKLPDTSPKNHRRINMPTRQSSEIMAISPGAHA